MYATAIFALIVLWAVGLIAVLHGTMWRMILAVLVSSAALVVTVGTGLTLGEGHAPPAFFIGALCFATVTFGLLLGLVWATDRRSMLWTTIFAVPVSLVVGFVMMWLPNDLDFFLTLPTGAFVLAVILGLLLWAIYRRRMLWTMIFAVLVSVVIGFIVLPFGLRGLSKLTRIYFAGAFPTGVFFFVATLSLLLGLAHYRRRTPRPSPPAPSGPSGIVRAPLWKISLLALGVGGVVAGWGVGYDNALRSVGSPSAVAVNPQGTRLYVYDSTAYAVFVIDTATHRRVGVLPVPHEFGTLFEDLPDARLYLLSPPWTTRGKQTVTVIDMTRNTILGTVEVENAAPSTLQGGLYGIKRSLGDPRDFSNTFNLSSVIELVDTTRSKRTVIPDGPAVATDPSGSRVYVGYRNSLMSPSPETPRTLDVAVLDATAGYKLVRTIRVWNRPPVMGPGVYEPTFSSLAVDPTGRTVIVGFNVAESQNMVAIIDAAAATVVSEIPGSGYPGAVAFDPSGERAYVSDFDKGRVSVLDLAGRTVTATIKVGDTPGGLAVAPSGKDVYVANSGGGTVSIIDTASGRVVATTRPWSLTMPPDSPGIGARASYGLVLLVLIAGLTLRYLMPTAHGARVVLIAMTFVSGVSFFFSFITGYLIAPGGFGLEHGLWRLIIIASAGFGLAIVSPASMISSWLLFKRGDYRLAALTSLAPLMNIVAIVVFFL